MKISNVLDPIHPTLDPRVWDNVDQPDPKLKPSHENWIKRTIYDVLHRNGYTKMESWLHLVLTGSLTTFQYSDDSDCDVSLFINHHAFPEWSRGEMIGLMVSQVDGVRLPGTPFPLQDYVVAKDVTPDMLYKPGLRSAWDLDKGHWLVPPEHREFNVEQQENGFYTWALLVADKMERLLRYEPDKAVQFYNQLHQRRMRDMKQGKGDYSESNIVYKFLAHRGLLPDIVKASDQYVSQGTN